jgi:Tol biopolymer transport system component
MWLGGNVPRLHDGRVGRALIAVGVLALVAGALGPGASAAPRREAPHIAPRAAGPQLVTSGSFRIGYAGGDAVRLAAVNADTGATVTSPTGDTSADEPSANGHGVAYTTHQPQHADADIAFQAPGRAPVALTSDGADDHHPALSPDGRFVAFDSDRAGQLDIWVVRTDGTGLRLVTTDPADDTEPTWSPNGDRIAFASNRDDPAGDIYLVPAAGGAATRLTTDPAADTQPAFSPAGNRIAFTTTRFQPAGSTGSGGTRAGTDIATIAVTGGAATRVDAGEQPAWSPDGNRLTYVSRATDPSGDVVVRTLATGQVRPVAAQPDRAETHPTWNGTTVVYARVVAGDSTDVFSAAADGQDRRDHTNRPGDNERGPAYSPDGNQLAYAEYQSFRSSRIVVAEADGHNPRGLTTFAGVLDQDPTWSPDGTMIAFSRTQNPNSDGQTSAIQIVRVADGTLLGGIPVPDYLIGDDVEPAWSPDGRHLALSRRASVEPPIPVTPRRIDRPARPGGSFAIDSTVGTPAIPPNPDVVLLIDSTGSMQGTIQDVQANLINVIAAVQSAQPTAQFAVAHYKDLTFDGADAFHVDAGLTNNQTVLQNAVNGLVAAGGGADTPEDWLNALVQVSTGAITFRPDSSRIVVLVGDAPSKEPSADTDLPRPSRAQAIAALQAAGVRVVAVNVGDLNGDNETVDAHKGQATAVTTATGGVLTQGTPQEVTDDILAGLHNLNVTVTASVQQCDPGVGVAFDPASSTVVGGDSAHIRETVSVSPGARPGTTLTCTLQYQISNGGGTFPVPLTVHVTDPAVPLVVVDDVTVAAQGPAAVPVSYQATAIDSAGQPLAAICTPPSGSAFPVGQSTVVCTATDGSGRVGRDTAHINVVDPAIDGSARIWLVTLDFPATDRFDVLAAVDLSEHVTRPCTARDDDRTPAWSPDGTRLAFGADGVLCVVDADGGNAASPVVLPGGRSGLEEDPAFSPDGTLIAFGLQSGDDPEEVWTMPAAGGTAKPVIVAPGGASQPAFDRLPGTGLSLSVASSPQPVFVGGAAVQLTFTVHNAATRPATRVRLAVNVPPQLAASTSQLLGTLPAGATAAVIVTLPAAAAVSSFASGLVTGIYPQNVPDSAQVQSTVEVRQPVLRVNPGLGPPGSVTIASGANFPPGVTVSLAWNPGIPAPVTVPVGPDGTFQIQVLVFQHDQLGNRQLVATGPGFGPVSIGFLVVPGSQQPRDFVNRR